MYRYTPQQKIACIARRLVQSPCLSLESSFFVVVVDGKSDATTITRYQVSTYVGVWYRWSGMLYNSPTMKSARAPLRTPVVSIPGYNMYSVYVHCHMICTWYTRVSDRRKKLVNTGSRTQRMISTAASLLSEIIFHDKKITPLVAQQKS